MKLKKRIIVGDCIVPTDCDLEFNNGIALYDGNEIELSKIPIDAMEYELQPELSQDIWDGEHLRTEVRDKLLSIANDFYESSGFKAPILDIIFTGSLANYNYHDGSDIDLHVVIDYSSENEDTELVRIAANGIKWRWNQEHNITISGHEVETYIQDSNEQHNSSGIYSIMHDEWIVKPEHRHVVIDSNAISSKADFFKYVIDDIEKQVNSIRRNQPTDGLLEQIDNIRYKVLRQRKDSFENGGDEFSTGNLVFKELRNSGYIEKIMNLEKQVYDRMNSIGI